MLGPWGTPFRGAEGVGMASAWETIETPAVLVDYGRMMANLRAMQESATRRGLALRPHAKAHKCLEIARIQVGLGACGVTVSKPDEAIVFLRGGIASVTLAFPLVDSPRARRLLAVARDRSATIRFIADSDRGVTALSTAAYEQSTPADVFLKVDVGLHRCGVRPEDPELVTLVRKIAGDPWLRFAGLLSHAGHAYGARDARHIREIAAEECAILARVRRRIEDAGIAVPEVSVGATPTALAGESYDGITEIRPGNYVFLDRTALALGVARPDQIALTILATVVSAGDEWAVVDAGSKTLSSDRGPHGRSTVSGYGAARPAERWDGSGAWIEVTRLSEEHGVLGQRTTRLAPGTRLRIVPNHACPVVNLADRLVVLGLGDEPVTWTVDARACVR